LSKPKLIKSCRAEEEEEEEEEVGGIGQRITYLGSCMTVSALYDDCNSYFKLHLLYAFFWVIPRSPASEFRRRGITQKKAYDIRNTAKVEIKLHLVRSRSHSCINNYY
jgi:hypothetical protein